MIREILTAPITNAQMFEELEFFIQHFRALGHVGCDLLFGFAWGNYYYPGNLWNEVRLPLASLMAEVEKAGALGCDGLGLNDLWLSVPSLPAKFLFCNDSDIHITFDEPGEVPEFFYQRWKSLGFQPAEWMKSDSGRCTERLREN